MQPSESVERVPDTSEEPRHDSAIRATTIVIKENNANKTT